MATPTAKKIHAENLRQRAHKEAKLRGDAEALAAKLAAATVKVAAKVSSKGKVFGSVNNIQVAEALAAMGIDVDRKNVEIVGADVVKATGAYEAVVKCYKDIKATVKFEVVPSDDSEPQEAEAAAEAPAAE